MAQIKSNHFFPVHPSTPTPKIIEIHPQLFELSCLQTHRQTDTHTHAGIIMFLSVSTLLLEGF